MTVREVIQSFISYVEDATGRTSADLRFPPKLVYHHLNMVRNSILYKSRLERSRFGVTDETIIQTIPCVELEEVDQVECPCAPGSGKYFFKSKFKIPRILGSTPLSVSSILGNIQFNHIRWYNMEDKINSSFKADSEQPYYTFKTIDTDSHLYVYSSEKLDDLQAVSITAVFQNPLEVSSFPKCCEVQEDYDCTPMEREFLIPDELQVEIFKQTIRSMEHLSIVSGKISDKINDNNNGTVQGL